MLPIEINGVDGTGGTVVETQFVAHSDQFLAHIRGRIIVQQEFPRLDFVVG